VDDPVAVETAPLVVETPSGKLLRAQSWMQQTLVQPVPESSAEDSAT
jgi:hypothetical protein